METIPSAAAYPYDLRHQVQRAARLSHVLARLVDRADAADPSFVWLVGRADEVRVVAGNAVHEWQKGRITQRVAAERLASYVRDLEETVGAFFLPRTPSESAVRAARSRDTLIDA